MGVSVALAAAPSGLASSVGQLPASRPITGKRLSGSPGLQPPFHSASAMGNKKFYEQHSSMKVKGAFEVTCFYFQISWLFGCKPKKEGGI